MKIEDLMKEWAIDSELDAANPTGETVRSAKMHSKYLNIMMMETARYHKADAELKKLKKAKSDYYLGLMSREELAERGWTQFQGRVIRAEVASYLDADDDIINAGLKLGIIKQKVEYLEAVMKQINNRGYQIRAIIDWEKFKSGQ